MKKRGFYIIESNTKFCSEELFINVIYRIVIPEAAAGGAYKNR